jgi:hypothetical protein
MLKANTAKVHWDDHRKHWTVEIQFGSEVLKRPIAKPSNPSASAAEIEDLKSQAVAIGRDEGYDLDASQVVVQTAGASA